MANVKDLIVNGAARVIGKLYASEFVGNLTGNASSATKATLDGSDNTITSTYATKTEVTNALAGKANSSHGTHVSGASFTSGNSSNGEHDANKITSNAIAYYTSNGPATSIGASTSDGALYCQAYSDSWVAQIAQDYRDGDLFVRGKNNGTWQSWKKVWVSGDSITAPTITATSGFTGNLTGNASTASVINGTYTGNGGAQPPSYVGNGQVRFNMMYSFSGLPNLPHYADCILMDTYTGSDVPYVTGLGIIKAAGNPRAFIAVGEKNNTTTWKSQAELITTANVASSNNTASWGSAVTVGTVGGISLKFTMPSNPTTDFDYRGKANNWSAKNTFTASSTVSASSGSGSGTINITQGGIWAAGGIYGNKVYNAIWNDLADCIPVDEECDSEPGYCYCFNGEKYYKSSKYLDDGIIGIYSDTYGMHMGYKPDLKQIPIAVAGFALAYVDKEYPVGTPLTCTENGYLTKIEKSDKIEWPEKIVATYWKNESEEYWGDKENKIKVNGRKWVKVK